jgi:hypothetical protein
MGSIAVDELRKVDYLDIRTLGDRVVNLMPLWDGTQWRKWVATPVGLVEVKLVDILESDYLASSAAKPSDLFMPFVHVMWQQASWPEIWPLIMAICDDFHNMGTSVAKLRHFFDCRCTLSPGSANRFAGTELEYLAILARTVFDLLQEMISIIWLRKKVHLLDESAETYRQAHPLPETFSKIVLEDKQSLRSADAIQGQYGLPRPLAEQYAKVAPFFSHLRDLRDRIVHGGSDIGPIYDTARGFCVNPKSLPFSSFEGWRTEHYFNENLTSVLPWIANVIVRTIEACNCLMTTFATIIQLPPDIGPGYRVFVRGPHNNALAEVLRVHSGASPWWE